MMSSGIQIHAKIPVQTDSIRHNDCADLSFRRRNGYVYRIQGACDTSGAVPIIHISGSGQEHVIGMANSVEWNPAGYIDVDGVLFFGGESEDVAFSSNGDTFSMEIEYVGL